EMYSDVVRIYLQKPIIEQIVQHETIVENMLEKYVDDHFHFLDYAYDNDDDEQLNHNTNQIDMIERLVSRKYELDLWKEEIQHLKNYEKQNQWPSSFDYINVGLPSFIETITDHVVRKQLIDQHRQILHEYKSQLLTLLIGMSEVNCSKLQNLFNSDMVLFWKHEHSLPIEERLSETILKSFDQR
ncbi:unnamed protein product, partial [Rotaria magnacalcarata]